MSSEAQLVIKLIQYAPNGYVPLHQLREMYHDKYGIHLKKRKKISKWIGKLPGVYINNNPVQNSIHFRTNSDLTRHKQDEAEDEANLVIKLIREAPNGYISLEHLRQMYRDKYGKYLERKKLLKWIRTLPDVYVDNNPVTLSIHIRADSRGLTTHTKKKKNKKINDKMAKGSNPSDNLPTPKPQKQKKMQKKRKAKVKASQINLPIRNDCYYGMANHKVDTQGGRKCIMHFGFTSYCETKSKYWLSRNTTKTKRRLSAFNESPFNDAIVNGYIANKIKKAGAQKADRKTRNLVRLQKKHNPMTAAPSSHAMQRYKERGFASTPIYKPMKGGGKAKVVTYVPIQREVYSDAKKSRLSIQLEVDRMSRKSDLPKCKLSSKDAYMFKLSSQAAKKEECRRRSQKKERAHSKQCGYPLEEYWTPLSINTDAPRDLHINGRSKYNPCRYKSAARRSSDKYTTLEYFQKRKAQKRSKKKSRVTRR